MSENLCSAFCTHPLVDATFPFGLNSNDTGKPLFKIGAEKALQVHVESRIPPLKYQKTTIDVLGICCPSEVPLIKKILEPLPGVEEVLVNVAARTVVVRHNSETTSAAWLVKILNDAKLEASIHRQGEWKATHKWPKLYTIVSGLIVALAFFHYLYGPLRWLGLVAVAVGIPPIVIRSFVSLKRCILDINVLMLIAVAGAIALGDYIEAGSIVFLFTLADWLESRSSDKARMAISSVASLAPQIAVLADSGMKVPVAEVAVGSTLSVKAGEQVPMDGVVSFGNSAVDESSLTGESRLVEKEAGATVWAGTLNMSGYLCIQTTALAEESAVSRMVRLVEEAQNQRSKVEKLVEKFAKYYTPVVVVVATGVAVIPLSLHAHNIRHWLYIALVLLVVACPCALVISTPVAATCAIARAAKKGVIVKSGSALEALGKLKVLALDKTGTLTEGHFQVINVKALSEDIDLARLLQWIACIESQSSHPMAASLVAYAKSHGIVPLDKVDNFKILAGEGVSGVINGHTIHIGNERLAKGFSWTQSEAVEPTLIESWRSQGWSISWIGLDENLVGIVCAGDPLRVEAREAVQTLKKLGLQLVMLTGDSFAVATVAQKKLGELEVHAQLFPQDKVEILSGFKTKWGCTGMVGDGINDAPALAVADVGIAMGVAGSAVAIENADIALMTNDLKQLAAAVKLGRRARSKIQQNIVLSLATKLLIILLAGFGFASLWAAVLADVGTCLIVIFNSMLLLGRGKGEGHHGHHNHYPANNCCDSRAANKVNHNHRHGHLVDSKHHHDCHPHPHHGHLTRCEKDHHEHHQHHGHHHHKHGPRPVSCEKKGRCSFKVKLSNILNHCMASRNQQGCCSHPLVMKGSIDIGRNTRMRCKAGHESRSLEGPYDMDCTAMAVVKVSEGQMDRSCNVTGTVRDSLSTPQGLDEDLKLCAAYCTDHVLLGAFSDVQAAR